MATPYPIILICPALRAVHRPPVSCASHPHVYDPWGLRVPSGHFGSHYRSTCYARRGGVRRKAL